ncbi:MAG: hypothetical protein RL264_1110 [Bacteroidota bacterium]|jgi:hypothetical protein
MRLLLTLVGFLIASLGLAQQGGYTAFPFLQSYYSARSMAFGGTFITVSDNDLSLAMDNPAVLNSSMNGHLHVNQSLLPTGINVGAANYCFNTKRGVFAPSIRYVNYGKFDGRDETGAATGSFSGLDYAIGTSYGYSLKDVIRIGASFNFIGSNMETYSSYGVALGFSAMYIHKNQLFSAGFSARNIGVAFKNYTSESIRQLPLRVDAGVSMKLKHAPFRFSLLAQRLEKWDIVYQDPNEKATYDPLTGDSVAVERPGFFTKLAHHGVFQVELLASKNFHLRGAFDYHRRAQLRLQERPGLAGFSFGVGLKIKKIHIDYSFLIYNKAGQQHAISLQTHLSDWVKK